MDGSLENLLAGLESSFDAALARDEEIAAADLARSLDRGAELRHRLVRARGVVLLLSSETRLPVANVGADYCACGDPPFLLAPLHNATFALGRAGLPPSDAPAMLKQALGRWADRSAAVEIATPAGRRAGRLVQASADHVLLETRDQRIVVPMATVGSVRLSRVG